MKRSIPVEIVDENDQSIPLNIINASEPSNPSKYKERTKETRMRRIRQTIVALSISYMLQFSVSNGLRMTFKAADDRHNEDAMMNVIVGASACPGRSGR